MNGAAHRAAIRRRIVESRDCVDHVAKARARGTLDDLVAAIAMPSI